MATNTAASFTNHTGNGSAGPFNISFSYLSEAEVDVTVGGVLKTITTHYTFTSATQITFTSGNEPGNGVAIKFQRDTNISAKKVDFADGSVLTEADLDANSDQVLFAQQEIIDKLGGIEEGATGDQTNAEIRTAVEAATDSNVFTDADHSKLNAIEASATADQTAAEIRTLVESASDSNVFTDADHTKLNGIEASATADQTNAEIRTAVEAASDSNVFTDADHTKLNAIEAGATADQTISEIKSLIAGSPLDATHLAANSVDSSELVDGSIDTSHLSADCVDSTKIADNAIGSEHLQANSVTTSEIADAELSTLAGMQSGTASKLADSTALTADIADLNQIDGMAKQTTITNSDSHFPTSGAVVDFVANQIAPVGGLEVIPDEDSFPSTQPVSGVVISITNADGLIINSSGVATNARTLGNGSDNVTINNFPASLRSKTLSPNLGLLVSSTGASQTYNYHKLLAKEEDVLQLSDDINDFNARYRVVSSNPTSDNDAGDLIFNTSTSKLLVYNATSGAFEEAQSIGNFFISTFSESFDGSRTDFTVSNAPANAQQIILSINGVVQKPNSGTSTPSEGFALSGNTVKLSSAPASGSDVFIVVMGSTVNIGTPSNNTVTSAILQNGSVIEGKLANNAVTLSKLFQGTAAGFIATNTNGNCTVPTFPSHSGDTFIVHDLLLQRDASNGDPVISAGSGASITYQTGTTASGAFTSILDTTGLQLGRNTQYVKLAAPADQSGQTSYTFTFPPISGTSGQALTTNGSGTTSWTTISSDLVDDTSPQLGGNLDVNGKKINFGDSSSSNDDRLTFGAAEDLQIFHDGSSNYISGEVDGKPLYLRGRSDLYLQCGDNSSGHRNVIYADNNGAARLYHPASNAERLRTTSGGVKVTGNVELAADGDTLLLGSSSDFQISHDGNNNVIKGVGNHGTLFYTNNVERMRIGSTGNVGIGVAPATGSRLRVNQADVTDYNASTAANNPAIIIGKSSGSGDGKCVGFSINGPNANAEFNAAMVGNGNNEGDFHIAMRNGGSRSDRFLMTHDGIIKLISNSTQHAKLLNDGNVFELRTSNNSGNAGMLIFRDGNADFCGQITSNGANNTTSYNSSSDYRLKTNAQLIADGITRIKNLKPYQFEWKSDLGTKVDGFFAHEAQTVVPEAVTGVKDEMQAILYKEGDEIPEGKKVGDIKEYSTTDIKVQTIDQAKLVPLLTAALQEAIAKIETLETKVAALEAK